MRAVFTCCECGRKVFRFPALREGEIKLCSPCVSLPDWFREPEIRVLIDPGHSDREVCERSEPAR